MTPDEQAAREIVCKSLAVRAEELQHALDDHNGWLGQVYLSALLDEIAAALARAREDGIMSRREWWEALHATYYAIFQRQAPETKKPCDMSHEIVIARITNQIEG